MAGFKSDFMWGAATSAYQIEGAAFEDGKGLSIWDIHTQRPDTIWQGHTADVACDHYHLYAEDVRLMQSIGLKAYRFSTSWPRILPNGYGQVNHKGLDFYDRLVDQLMAVNIVPYLTLFHWDLPQEIHQKGGWLNSDIVTWFAEYAAIVAAKLGDRVSHWITLNEPASFILQGYQNGAYPPGARYSNKDVLQTIHYALMSHGAAVQAIRAHAPKTPHIGFAPVGNIGVPSTDADVEIAREAMFSTQHAGFWNLALWYDPLFFKQYPEDFSAIYQSDMPNIKSGDFELIAQPIDMLAINIYTGSRYTVDSKTGKTIAKKPELGAAMMGIFDWEVMPQSLYWGPKYLYERYGLPVVITENGLPNPDWRSLDGAIHDPQRVNFITRYLSYLKKAVDDGIAIDGYFYWSVMDNFEWLYGYQYRFGLTYVDFKTRERILKDSAHWYRAIIASNGALLPDTMP